MWTVLIKDKTAHSVQSDLVLHYPQKLLASSLIRKIVNGSEWLYFSISATLKFNSGIQSILPLCSFRSFYTPDYFRNIVSEHGKVSPEF